MRAGFFKSSRIKDFNFVAGRIKEKVRTSIKYLNDIRISRWTRYDSEDKNMELMGFGNVPIDSYAAVLLFIVPQNIAETTSCG